MSKKKSETAKKTKGKTKAKPEPAESVVVAETSTVVASTEEAAPVETALEKTETPAAETATAQAPNEPAAAPSADGIPETLNTPEFVAAWAEWVKFTEDRGIGLEEADKARQLAMLAKLGPDAAIGDIRRTMADHPLKDRVATNGGTGAKKERKKRGPKAGKMSALDAAAKVLEESGTAMTTQEMIDAMAKKGYWSSPGGLTPAATLYSAILREMGKGATSRFKKTERGKFARA